MLMERPGRWAIVGRYYSAGSAATTANLLRCGLVRDIEPGTVEAVSRTVDGEFRVYARYVGEPS